MKSNFILSLIVFTSFSITSHAAGWNPLTWADWEESQEIKTAVGKEVSLDRVIALNKIIGEQNTLMTNSDNLIVDKTLTISEDYYPEDSDDDAYCEVNFYTENPDITSINSGDTGLFITHSIGNRGRNWKDGKFSWVSASFSNNDESVSGDVTCYRIGDTSEIGYVPFIKMLSPVVKFL